MNIVVYIDVIHFIKFVTVRLVYSVLIFIEAVILYIF